MPICRFSNQNLSTWHTNRDTYDKIVVADLQNNANLVAMLTYLADKDPNLQAPQLITTAANGNPITYPACGTNKSTRKSADSRR